VQTALGAASLAGVAVIVVFSFAVLIRLETLTSQPEKRRRFLRWWAPMVVAATLIGLVGLAGQLLLS
jgi:fumarate reductase subunit C